MLSRIFKDSEKFPNGRNELGPHIASVLICSANKGDRDADTARGYTFVLPFVFRRQTSNGKEKKRGREGERERGLSYTVTATNATGQQCSRVTRARPLIPYIFCHPTGPRTLRAPPYAGCISHLCSIRAPCRTSAAVQLELDFRKPARVFAHA